MDFESGEELLSDAALSQQESKHEAPHPSESGLKKWVLVGSLAMVAAFLLGVSLVAYTQGQTPYLRKNSGPRVVANGGNAPKDSECSFPFIIYGQTHNDCTEIDSPGAPWCSIADADGGATSLWGYCEASTSYHVIRPLADFVAVLDNKGGSGEKKPRLAVVEYGSLQVVLEGDASVLKAHDLESVSLINQDEGLYVAADSLGKTHVFNLLQTETGYAAKQVATGQLPVPDGEVTDYRSPNRTNIEATRCWGSPPSVLGAGPVMMWGARGGSDYAGAPGPCRSVWLRWAPFDPASGNVEKSKMQETRLTNLGDTGAWRALSSLDLIGERLYFTAAFDGEDHGVAVDTSDTFRTDANTKAFKSLVGTMDLSSGVGMSKPTVVSRFDGMKLEGVCAVTPTPGTPSVERLLLASDDEALGSLVTDANLMQGGFEPDLGFVNLGLRASARNKKVDIKQWGVSGIAMLGFVAADRAE